MIEMQVCVDHERHVLRGMPGLPDAILKRRPPVAAAVLDPVDVVELGRFLVTRPGIDQHQPVGMLDQQAPHPHGNSVLVVGR